MSPGSGLALFMLVLGEAQGPSLRYPLGERGPRDFAAAGEPFKLVDVSYRLADESSTRHAFRARLKVRDWGYLGGETDGERRALTWSGARLEAALASDQGGAWGLSAGVRLARVLVSAEAERRGDHVGGGWRLAPALRLRLTPDLEWLASAAGDTARPDDRLLRTLATGVAWQWRAKLEALAEVRRDYLATDADAENRVDALSAALVAQWGAAELRVNGAFQDTTGRFPREEWSGTLGGRVPVASRLLAEVEAEGRLERRVGARSHLYRGALTWHGRRFTLPRSGEAAARSLALARAATAAGHNERRVFDDDAIRAQRERLALGRERAALGAGLLALYEAQLAERSVPLLGVELRETVDRLSGSSRRVLAAFVGVPWPPAPPWRANEAAVPFLKLGYERERHTSGPDFHADTDCVNLTVSLDREMDLVVSWRRAEPSALDLVRGIGRRTTFEAAYVYAFGR